MGLQVKLKYNFNEWLKFWPGAKYFITAMLISQEAPPDWEMNEAASFLIIFIIQSKLNANSHLPLLRKHKVEKLVFLC